MNDLASHTSKRRSGITLRAVALGLVSVVFLCWLANYQLHVTWSSEMSVTLLTR